MRLGDGAVQMGELHAALPPLAPLRVADAAALRAAIASYLRSRLLAGAVDAAALQSAEVATMLVDRATVAEHHIAVVPEDELLEPLVAGRLARKRAASNGVRFLVTSCCHGKTDQYLVEI